MAREYARFGEGFVTRASADEEWVACEIDDVPGGFFEEENNRDKRKRRGARGAARFVHRAPRDP